MNDESKYDPFFNVRKGGPKEKRIRRVELMGEHKPKPIYYVKITIKEANDNLSLDLIKEEFQQFGVVGDIYRPIDQNNVQRQFVFVGYFDQRHVLAATTKMASAVNPTIEDVDVTVEEAKLWMLELYPRTV